MADTATPTSGTGHVTDISEFGKLRWSYLTGSGAVIDYPSVGRRIGVPTTTGPDAEVATWSLEGTLRITTSDRDNSGASNGRAS